MTYKPKFKKCDIVTVKSQNNASQFNPRSNIMGVFKDDNWLTREYTVGGFKNTNLGYGLCPFAYSLYFNGKLEGYVYETELKFIRTLK